MTILTPYIEQSKRYTITKLKAVGGYRHLTCDSSLTLSRLLAEAEFDFQVGDIIAVTHTPADGWWSGELLWHFVPALPGPSVASLTLHD